jgi:hypothetical protein
MPIGNPRWLPPQVIVLTQNHMGKIQKYILKDYWTLCPVNLKKKCLKKGGPVEAMKVQ